MTSTQKPIGYNDLYFRIIISLIAAHIIVSFGAKESFFSLLISWDYYRSLLLSFVIAFFLITEVYIVTVRLDRRFDWKESTAKRIGLQLLFGLVLPSITAFLLATIYFWAFGYNILDTYYLEFDFPVIAILLILLNVYYLAFYFYLQWQFTESRALIISQGNEGQQNKEVIVVQEGTKSIPLQIESIYYFYHDGEYNFARTCDRDDFVISETLDEIQLQLNTKQFFRVNRQMIVNFTACEHFEPLSFGKLQLRVTPPTKEPVIISQKRAKLFKEWIGR